MHRLGLLVATLVLATPVYAQSLPDWAAPVEQDRRFDEEVFAPDPVAGAPGDDLPDPPPMPVDGGLWLLAAAGGALALRRRGGRPRS